MFFLKVLLFVVGVAFTALGFCILVLGKHNLINGFEKKYALGRRDETYARSIGAAELVGGLVCCALAFLALFFGKWFVAPAYIAGVGGTLAALIVCEIRAGRRLS